MDVQVRTGYCTTGILQLSRFDLTQASALSYTWRDHVPVREVCPGLVLCTPTERVREGGRVGSLTDTG